MKLPFYNFECSSNSLRFEFESTSPSKNIRKVVEYTPIPQNPNIYNLGFGDLRADGSIDDLVVSNNNDLEMVLSTVVQTIFKFFEAKPDKTVVFLGSTESRTRLYQMTIAKYINEVKEVLEIRGIRNGIVENFVKGINYEAFLINLK